VDKNIRAILNRTSVRALFTVTLYLITSVWAFYIGRFETIYGAGALLVLIIQGLGLVSALITLILPPHKLFQSLKFGAYLTIVLQSLMIIIHEIEEYKPVYEIRVPSHVKGCVYLFLTPYDRLDVDVNDQGIGYIGSQGKVIYEIVQDNEDITDAFQTGLWNEIVLYENDSLTMIVYGVQCFNVKEENNYQDLSFPYWPWNCMDGIEFQEWLEAGRIEENQLQKKIWHRSSMSSNDWIFDHRKSRL